MKQAISFLNKHDLTAGDVILTSMIGTIATMIVVSLFESYVQEWLKSAFSKPKAYVDKKLRWRKGKLTIGEAIELQRKKEAGESLRADVGKRQSEYTYQLLVPDEIMNSSS